MVYRISLDSHGSFSAITAFLSTAFSALAVSTCLLGCASEDLQGAKAEVADKTDITLSLPAVPEFPAPASLGDGSRSVAEMRLRSGNMLNTDVSVRGFVVWIYDCAKALQSEGMSDKDVAKLVQEKPQLCTRPHFYIAAAADHPQKRGILVAEYPRPLRPDEKRSATPEYKAQLAAIPAFKVGDEVTVSGTWTTKSPNGFVESDGLLVYKSMKQAGEVSEQ